MSGECFLGYGDQPFGGDFYGTGEYRGVQPRDIVLYYPAADGSINFNAAITYLPSPDEKTVRKILDLTPLGEGFFSDIKELKAKRTYVSFHKLWIYNASENYDFTEASVEIDTATDPEGWISLAPTVLSAPLPVGNEVNTQGGDGPGAFDVAPVDIGTLTKGSYKSFWVRRKVVVQNEDQYNARHTFIITGKTLVDGEHCEFP